MLTTIKHTVKSHGYKVFKKPFELNIIGIRSNSTNANSFDDTLRVFYKDDAGKWQHFVFPITTDPGTFWLENPMNEKGTAILTSGQYENAYKIGFHQGKYKALVQAKPVTVLRDYDRNDILEFFNGEAETGQFGINIHRALSVGDTKYIDRHSAGCQVFQNAEDYYQFMHLCELHRERHGNSFTYSLIDFRIRRRVFFRNALIGSALIGLGVLSYQYYKAE